MFHHLRAGWSSLTRVSLAMRSTEAVRWNLPDQGTWHRVRSPGLAWCGSTPASSGRWHKPIDLGVIAKLLGISIPSATMGCKNSWWHGLIATEKVFLPQFCCLEISMDAGSNQTSNRPFKKIPANDQSTVSLSEWSILIHKCCVIKKNIKKNNEKTNKKNKQTAPYFLPGRVVMRQGLLWLGPLELDLATHPSRAAVVVPEPGHRGGAVERNTWGRRGGSNRSKQWTKFGQIWTKPLILEFCFRKLGCTFRNAKGFSPETLQGWLCQWNPAQSNHTGFEFH